MDFQRIIALAFLPPLLLFSGCLIGTPTPLNETGFLPPIQNYTQPPSGGAPSFSGAMECTMAAPGGGSATLFMLGSRMRTDYTDLSTNISYSTLADGNAYYMGAGNLSSNCTWLYLNSSAFKGLGYNTTMPGFGPTYTPSLPDCRAGNFTDEIFRVDGAVCDFAQLMNLTINLTE